MFKVVQCVVCVLYLFQPQVVVGNLRIDKPCVKCSYESIHKGVACYADLFLRRYVPVQSPLECVNMCRVNPAVQDPYQFNKSREGNQQQEKYALISWVKNKNSPMCACISERLRSSYVETEVSNCNQTCPDGSMCGGSFTNWRFFATIYLLGDFTAPDNTTSGYNNEDTYRTTLSSSSTLYSFENYSTTTDFMQNSSEHDYLSTTTTSSVTTNTEFPSTTSPAIANRSDTGNSHCLMCKSHDRRGIQWEACAGKVAIMNCTVIHNNSMSAGVARWKCGKNGVFETKRPNISNCSSIWLQNQQEQVEKFEGMSDANKFLSTIVDDVTNKRNRNSSRVYFGHEIKSVTSLVQRSIDKATELAKKDASKFTELQTVVDKAIDINAHLLYSHDPWTDLSKEEKLTVSTNIISNTEEILFQLSDVAPDANYAHIFEVNSSGPTKVLIMAESLNLNSKSTSRSSYEFPPKEGRSDAESYIELPPSFLSIVDSNEVAVAAMSMDSESVTNIMPGQYEQLMSKSSVEAAGSNSKLMNSKFLSLSLRYKTTGSRRKRSMALGMNETHDGISGKGVQIKFNHDIEAWGDSVISVPRRLHNGESPKAVLGTSSCVFWDTNDHVWSTVGCKTVKADRYDTICECSHLTSFAILMDVHQYVGKQLGLEIITWILCPLSEIALALSIVLLSSVKGPQKLRSTITKHLSICLLVGNVFVLLVLDRNYFNMSDGFCTGTAMFTHYVYLAAFNWMLVEGFQLYKMVVEVFESGKSYMTHFMIFSYGSPILVVGITSGIGYGLGDKPYGGDYFCWLEGPYIWHFMAPVAIITMVNFIVLIIAMRTAYLAKKKKKNALKDTAGKLEAYLTLLKGCFSLSVLLGLTWAVGFFTIMRSQGGTVAAYIFTVLNASQGIFIFIFNCVLNDQIRSSTRRRLYRNFAFFFDRFRARDKADSSGGTKTTSSTANHSSDTNTTRVVSETSQETSFTTNRSKRIETPLLLVAPDADEIHAD